MKNETPEQLRAKAKMLLQKAQESENRILKNAGLIALDFFNKKITIEELNSGLEKIFGTAKDKS